MDFRTKDSGIRILKDVEARTVLTRSNNRRLAIPDSGVPNLLFLVALQNEHKLAGVPNL